LIEQVAHNYPVQAACEALDISRSGYYAHKKKPGRKQRKGDQAILPKVRSAFEKSRGTYGTPRIRIELAREGVRCGRRRIGRLMRQQGLKARNKRQWRRSGTTVTDPALATAPNHLAEIPRPDRPNQVWVNDITYLPTRQGWHYLAVVMDLFSRRVVGWATSESLETPLVTKALERAIALRGTAPGLIHHSDRGCQYASRSYRTKLNQSGITASMSRKGNCYDTAAMESFFATLKTEVFDPYPVRTRREAELKVFDFVEGFYNPRRIHLSLGGKSPMEFETLSTPHPNTTNTLTTTV
jgi:transposase InsO family protein